MKKILKCKVTLLLLMGWAVLSVMGYLGRDTIYKNYSIDIQTTPYFVLVFDGIHDGVYPWSGYDKSQSPEMLEKPTEDKNGSDGTGTPEYVAEATELSEEDKISTSQKKEFCEVDEDYFDDAVFIGDSRTVGLHDYGGLDHATFFATVGLNVYDMWKEEFCEVDGKKMTLEEALKKKQYNKLYFQVGINEMGRGNLDSFMEAYQESVEKFRKLQPNAIIYVQGIMRVAREKSEQDKIFNNQAIQARNERIAELADNQTIFYIDMNEVVCDSTGNLKDELTFDNIHLYGSKYGIWVDFLKTKGIKSEAA